MDQILVILLHEKQTYRDKEIKSQEMLKELKRRVKQGKSQQERRRAHGIVLSHGGMDVKEIAKVFDVTERSVYLWLDAWDERGFESLRRKKGDGRKPILKEDEHKEIISGYIEKYPHQPKKAYSLTVEELKIEVSYKTFRRFLKKYLD